MPSFDKDSWIKWMQRQEELAFEVAEKLKDRELKFEIIREENKPPIIRIIKKSNDFMDFKIKEVRSSYGKDFWIAKVKDVGPRTNFMIHSKKEGHWLWVSGPMLLAKADRRKSDYHDKALMLVAPRNILKNLSRMLTEIKKTKEQDKQKRITKWMNG